MGNPQDLDKYSTIQCYMTNMLHMIPLSNIYKSGELLEVTKAPSILKESKNEFTP